MLDWILGEDPALRIVQTVKEHVVASERDLLTIESPYTIYKAAAASIKTNVDQAFLHLLSASSLSDVSRLQEDMVRQSGELNQLE